MIGGWLAPIADAVRDGGLTLISSEALLRELEDVLARPRIGRFVGPEDSELLVSLLSHASHFATVGAPPKICRDASDDFLLALAAASRADFLVTRDEDLLVLGNYESARIVYPAIFLKILAGEGA